MSTLLTAFGLLVLTYCLVMNCLSIIFGFPLKCEKIERRKMLKKQELDECIKRGTIPSTEWD